MVLSVKDEKSGTTRTILAKTVFLGAGGGALPLLQKSGIEEGKGFGGFPVSGIFLRCDNRAVVDRHDAKVYGKASVGAPPMSVPHLDTRYVGRKALAAVRPVRRIFDEISQARVARRSLRFDQADNIGPMLAVGRTTWI